MDPRAIDKIVAFIRGDLWYRVIVSPSCLVRARELAAGRAAPDFRIDLTAGLAVQVVVETPDPEWFLELDIKLQQAARQPR